MPIPFPLTNIEQTSNFIFREYSLAKEASSSTYVRTELSVGRWLLPAAPGYSSIGDRNFWADSGLAIELASFFFWGDKLKVSSNGQRQNPQKSRPTNTIENLIICSPACTFFRDRSIRYSCPQSVGIPPPLKTKERPRQPISQLEEQRQASSNVGCFGPQGRCAAAGKIAGEWLYILL